jgi:asparagine synthase (glutamine-hydrolysing)
MSSICGVFHRDGRPATTEEIDSMVQVLAHWGPDRTGSWVGGEIALGHLALWTTPESICETQPYLVQPTGVVVTADARIDNGDDLVRELGLTLLPGQRAGAAELIAAAYEKWGDDCPEHLIGDFAFALWDPRRKTLLCARDPMGLRPFYYFAAPDRFLFGTEIKAIFTDERIPRDLDRLRLMLYVIAAHQEGERTQYAAVRGLEPATLLVIDGQGARTRRYWRLDEEREIHFERDDDYVDAFDELLQSAVDARLRCAFPVGGMLSGGLDSTTLIAFASRSRCLAQPRMVGFTWALAEGDDWYVRDEREFVDAYLRENSVVHHYVVPDATRIFADCPELNHFHDGPNWDLFHYASTPTFARAAEHGVRALIFGNGGDETASYFAPDCLVSLMLQLRPGALLAELRAHERMSGTLAARLCYRRVVRPLIGHVLGRRRDTFHYERGQYGKLAKVTTPDLIGIPLSQAAIAETGIADYLRSRQRRFAHPLRHPVRCGQIARLTGLNSFATLASLKWNRSVLHHIECRYPFLDRRVIEYCVALPAAQHCREGWSRRLLRRSAARRIPTKIAWRTTRTQTFPDIQRGIASCEADLRPRFERWERSPAISSYLDAGRLSRHLDQLVQDAAARRSNSSRDTPSFCRSVLLGLYLDGVSA